MILQTPFYTLQIQQWGGGLDDFKGLCFEKDYKIIAFGSSHGGYLALKTAQIAPWLIDGVIENSCYVKIPWRLFGLGKWRDFVRESEFSVDNVFRHIICLVSTKTHFSLDENSKNYFCKDHENIRQIYDERHIKTWANFRKIPIISYHSVGDKLALSDDKVAFFEDLAKLGFENDFHLIKDESEVDGKFIKTLEHGMGLSLKTLIIKELPKMLELKKSKTRKKPRIVYEGEKFDYIFEQKDNEIVLELKRK